MACISPSYIECDSKEQASSCVAAQPKCFTTKVTLDPPDFTGSSQRRIDETIKDCFRRVELTWARQSFGEAYYLYLNYFWGEVRLIDSQSPTRVKVQKLLREGDSVLLSNSTPFDLLITPHVENEEEKSQPETFKLKSEEEVTIPYQNLVLPPTIALTEENKEEKTAPSTLMAIINLLLECTRAHRR